MPEILTKSLLLIFSGVLCGARELLDLGRVEQNKYGLDIISPDARMEKSAAQYRLLYHFLSKNVSYSTNPVIMSEEPTKKALLEINGMLCDPEEYWDLIKQESSLVGLEPTDSYKLRESAASYRRLYNYFKNGLDLPNAPV